MFLNLGGGRRQVAPAKNPRRPPPRFRKARSGSPRARDSEAGRSRTFG